MAKVNNQILGNVSGRIGGLIFSSNQFGSHVYTRPHSNNSNTSAQRASQNSFSANPIIWSNEIIDQKQAWNSFAKTQFSNPRKKNNTKFTGYTTFKSCISTLQTMLAHIVSTNIDFNTGVHQYPLIVDSTLYPDYPLPHMLVPSFAGNTNNFAYLKLMGVTLNFHSVSTFGIGFLGNLNLPIDNDYFQDFYKQQIGFAFYASSEHKSISGPFTNPFKQLLSFTGFIHPITGGLSACTSFILTQDLQAILQSHNHVYSTIHYVLVTCVIVGTTGAMAKVGDFVAVIS